MQDSNFWNLKPTESLVSATQTTKFKKVKATLKNQKIKSVELFFNKCTSFHIGSLDKMLQLANTRGMNTNFFQNLPVYLYLSTTLYMSR